mgnify:CR=1 FL=1
MEQGEVTNLSYLHNMCDGDRAFMEEMIYSYLDDIPQAIEDIRQYKQEEAWELLGKAVHKIKPSVQFMGLSTIEPLIIGVEKDGKHARNTDTLPGRVEKIITVLEASIPELQRKINNGLTV